MTARERRSEAAQQRIAFGDVILIKGRHDQRLERISLAFQGHTVRCGIERCEVKGNRSHPGAA